MFKFLKNLIMADQGCKNKIYFIFSSFKGKNKDFQKTEYNIQIVRFFNSISHLRLELVDKYWIKNFSKARKED